MYKPSADKWRKGPLPQNRQWLPAGALSIYDCSMPLALIFEPSERSGGPVSPALLITMPSGPDWASLMHSSSPEPWFQGQPWANPASKPAPHWMGPLPWRHPRTIPLRQSCWPRHVCQVPSAALVRTGAPRRQKERTKWGGGVVV